MKEAQQDEVSRVNNNREFNNNGPRITPRTARWESDLSLRDAPPAGKADTWDELNHLKENYLEFSMASDILRGIMFFLGLFGVGMGLLLLSLPLRTALNLGQYDSLFFVGLLGPLLLFTISAFFLRFDLRLPKDRPVRFNRRQGKVYANTYTWNHNPFGRWRGGVKVFDWHSLQAEITKHVGISGEVVTQRYNLDLVVCESGDAGQYKEVDRFRLQQGAQTIGQYAEQWEFIRRYMNNGLEGLPKQNLRNPNPAFVDCLMFMMPWFAPTEAGRRFRRRHQNPFVVFFMLLMAIPFPLWLIFGLGNYIVMKIAPNAVWPSEMDEESKR